MKNKPSIYISSTIFDFEDMRSALKHWLEGQGYEVLLSEANDFPVDRSKDSYQACLDAISRCGYFMLFIGSRVGGLFDKDEQISITRKEYQRAYELAQQSKIRIISFVRKSVWNYRHCQKELETYLKKEFCWKKEIDEASIEKILNRPSDFATQAKQIISFIDEVARIEEMKKMTNGDKTDRPISNWIHAFSTFQEIVDCLKIEFAIDDDKKKKLVFLLEKEICENLTEILVWYEEEGKVLEDFYDGDLVRSKMQGESKDKSSLDASMLASKYLWLWTTNCTCSKMSTRYIGQSIDSGLFLKYNNSNDRYEHTKLSDALWLLQKEIHSFQCMINSPEKELFVKYREFEALGSRHVEIKNRDLGLLLAVSDRKYNIVYLSKAILRTINGNPDLLEKFTPKPFSPFKDVEEGLKKERPDEGKVMAWALGQ